MYFGFLHLLQTVDLLNPNIFAASVAQSYCISFTTHFFAALFFPPLFASLSFSKCFLENTLFFNELDILVFCSLDKILPFAFSDNFR